MSTAGNFLELSKGSATSSKANLSAKCNFLRVDHFRAISEAKAI
jgi:hypothetical protein